MVDAVTLSAVRVAAAARDLDIIEAPDGDLHAIRLRGDTSRPVFIIRLEDNRSVIDVSGPGADCGIAAEFAGRLQVMGIGPKPLIRFNSGERVPP